MAYLNKIYVIIGLGVLIMALGSVGDITLPPINKAVLLGSGRVNIMSCTATYGPGTIGWSYVPVGGSSSSPITISVAGSPIPVVPEQNQSYAVEQSQQNNNLIILSATTSRAGTYLCNEGANQRSAQLIIFNSDPVCNMTPNVPKDLQYNETVQMSCSITYTANSYVSVEMSWSNGSFVSNALPQTTTSSANLTTAISTITQATGYSSPFPIYRCTTTFKITGNPTGSANNAPDYSNITSLFNSPINVIYLRPANASSITGAKDGDQVYLGTILTCTVDGNPTPSYSWLDDTAKNTTNNQTIQIWHSGLYRCTASNMAASSPTSVSINVTTYSGLSETQKIIIGVVVGVGGALLIAAVAIVIYCCLKKKNKAGTN